MDVELTVGFMSFTETYVSKVTCRPYESVEVSYLAMMNSCDPLMSSAGRGSCVHSSVQVSEHGLEIPACTSAVASSVLQHARLSDSQ